MACERTKVGAFWQDVTLLQKAGDKEDEGVGREEVAGRVDEAAALGPKLDS